MRPYLNQYWTQSWAPVIPSYIGRLRIGDFFFAQPGQKKVHEIPSQLKKAGHGGMYPATAGSVEQPARAKARPCVQNNQSKKGWRCVSSHRALALQA
jgi:hypothetical protein